MQDKPIAAGKSSFSLIDTDALFAELALGKDTVFLDLACGTGLYSLAAAERIGVTGKIFAFDLWPEGIDALNEEIETRQIKRIQTGIVDVTKAIPLEARSVDVCLLATVLHDFMSIHSEKKTLLEIKRVLKPDGTLAVIEFKMMDGPPGPPIQIRIAPETVSDLLASYGFCFIKTLEIGPFNYLSLFQLQTPA
jgi:ubiquinone/menaquinone biosynthesis C-methylase UbiE